MITINAYDDYGVLKSIPWPDIKKGDLVSYLDPRRIDKKKVVIKLVGTWDGEKVQFNDDQKTLIRTTRWLTKEKRKFTLKYFFTTIFRSIFAIQDN